jgi:hypothetical protein
MKIWRTEEVAWRRIDRETVVVHLARRWMYALNEAGGELWEELAAPLEGDRLTRLLNDPAAAAFLADLIDMELVECEGSLPEIPPSPPAGDGTAAPRIEWREEVRRFAGQCGLIFGQSEICTQNPTNS